MLIIGLFPWMGFVGSVLSTNSLVPDDWYAYSTGLAGL